jgi:hypothetical protein
MILGGVIVSQGKNIIWSLVVEGKVVLCSVQFHCDFRTVCSTGSQWRKETTVKGKYKNSLFK